MISLDDKVIKRGKDLCMFLYTVDNLQVQKNVNLSFSKLKSLSNYLFQLINISADKGHIYMSSNYQCNKITLKQENLMSLGVPRDVFVITKTRHQGWHITAHRANPTQ